MLTSDRTIKWIENLAEQERLIRSGEKTSLDLCTTKDEVLACETSGFIRNLFYHLEDLVRLFNGRVDHSALKLKLERCGEAFDGFKVSRNGVQLSASAKQAGAIHLICERIASLEGQFSSGVQFSGSIEARFEPFHEVKWYFLDSPVGAEQIARHYLTEFLQVSRSTLMH